MDTCKHKCDQIESNIYSDKQNSNGEISNIHA